MGDFSKKIDEQRRLKFLDNLKPEDKNKREITLINDLIKNISNKENRYIFYCPDLPIPLATLKTIYQTVSELKKLGFNSFVLHETNNFKPEWLKEEYEVNKLFINTDKKGKKTTFDFKTDDTFIVPDGFIGIMESVSDIKTINKIVYLMSYEGLAVLKDNNWNRLGFNKVLSVSKQLIEDYKSCFPELSYYYLPFYINENSINKFLNVKEKNTITIFSRNKKDSSQLINIFYNKYGFLDVFNFKIIRTLDSDEYYKSISESCLMILMDSESGCTIPPIEASYFGVPVIMFEGRNMEHLDYYKENLNIIPRDIFLITEVLAEFCLNYLTKFENRKIIKDKEYTLNNFKKRINIFNDIQNEQLLKFENILKSKTNEYK